MDGILISSIGSVERSWTIWANLHGIDPEYACRVAHGCRSVDTIALLRPDLDVEAENDFIEGMEIADTEGIILLPGVLDLLQSLPPDRWTVVTSATDQLARVRLAAGGVPVPDRLITAESITEGAALLGFAPEDCVVFEDAASGTKSGHAAGCKVVATTFSHPVEALDAADYIVEDVTGVKVKTLANGEGLVLTLTPLAG
jgi:sugar-phosphatase